jgi:MFS family permease
MTEEKSIEFKKSYVWIFSINYFVQGASNSMSAVIIPIYLLLLLANAGKTVTGTEFAFLASIIQIPWSIKLIYGIISDKYGSKRYGRRKPYVIGPVIMSGLFWFLIPFVITPENAITAMILIGLCISTGLAFGDTSIDGMIMDICPKEQLGRTQGFCWSLRSIGRIAGGPIFAYLIVIVQTITAETIFIIVGIATIASSFLTLIVKEAEYIPEVNLKLHIIGMFNKRKDWITYFYSMLSWLIEGAAGMFLSFYILIKLNLIELKGTTLSLETTDLNIYIYQANIALLFSIGVVIGAIIGGQIADLISRKKGMYISVIIISIALLLMVLDISVIFLIIFAILVLAGLGMRHSSYSAVIGEMAKKHPEMDSTYFSLCNSFANFGIAMGLIITGILFDFVGGSFTFIFIISAFVQIFCLIPFLLLDKQDYEINLTK